MRSTSPEGPQDGAGEGIVRRALDAARRRAAWTHAAESAGLATMTAVAGTLAIAALRPASPAAVAALVVVPFAGLFTWRLARRRVRSPADAARLIEARQPLKNVLVTAEELLRHPERAKPYIAERVMADAASRAGAVDLAALIPARRATAALALTAAFWAAFGMIATARPHWLIADRSGPSAGGRGTTATAGEPGASIRSVRATITPPAYIGRPGTMLDDPDRIEAIAGSTLDLRVESLQPVSLRDSAHASPNPMGPAAPNVFSASRRIDATGYLVIETMGGRGDRRLLAIVARPDRAPRVEIGQPGRDLMLPDAARRVSFAIAASDDFGLDSLRLSYTKVSGSGEQFDFSDGQIPLAVRRADDRRWTATATAALGALGLSAGDILVYRAIARDRRAGLDAEGSSETFAIEIARPGLASEGDFQIPDEKDKYALSQQMIILKTERLEARRRTLSDEAFARASLEIAAEQRSVRAEFTFLMGGEVEDEEEEAAHSHEIEEGRLQNRGRAEMREAIRFMMQAEQRLVAADTRGALPPERAALAALQRAFDRTRYFLRTIPMRSRIDPARRLTGDLGTAASSSRAAADPGTEPRTQAAREALGGLLELASRVRGGETGAPVARQAADLAERTLALEPADPAMQEAAARLSRVAEALGRTRGSSAAALEDLQAAAAPLLGAARAGLAGTPAAAGAGDALLAGAFTDALRKPRP
jgi:hypothetical protein